MVATNRFRVDYYGSFSRRIPPHQDILLFEGVTLSILPLTVEHSHSHYNKLIIEINSIHYNEGIQIHQDRQMNVNASVEDIFVFLLVEFTPLKLLLQVRDTLFHLHHQPAIVQFPIRQDTLFLRQPFILQNKRQGFMLAHVLTLLWIVIPHLSRFIHLCLSFVLPITSLSGNYRVLLLNLIVGVTCGLFSLYEIAEICVKIFFVLCGKVNIFGALLQLINRHYLFLIQKLINAFCLRSQYFVIHFRITVYHG